MQIPFTLGTGTDKNADPIDRLPVNFLYTPKPNFEYMDMTPGLTKLTEGVGVDRGGAYIQTDKLKGHFRVSGDKLIKLEGDNVTIIDNHKIVSFTLTVETDRTNVKIGSTTTIKATFDGGESLGDVEYSSDQSPETINFAKDNNNCIVSGVKEGSATLKVKLKDANDSLEIDVALTVIKEDEDAIKFSESKTSRSEDKDNIVIDGEGAVVLTPTNNNLAITTGSTQYLYSEKYGLRPNPAENIQSPKDTAFMNERLIDVTHDSETDITYIVQHAAGEDGVIKPLAYGTSDALADEIVGIGYVTGNRVAVFNRFSIEFFRDDGNETTTKQFTLVREEGRAIDGGLASTNLKAPFAGGWALIGGKKNQQINVHIAQPGSLNPIGTSEIQKLLSTYTQEELDKSWLESKEIDGHVLLICQLTRHTLQFDAATQQWSILKTGLANDVWRASHGVYDPIQSKWIYGDKQGPSICHSDKSTFSQYGEQQEAILYTPMMPMYNQLINLMQIRTISGRYPQGYKQNCFVSHSVLGGQAFGNENIKEVAMGMTPDQRFLLRGLGMANGDMGFKVRFSTIYPTGISASMEIQ